MKDKIREFERQSGLEIYGLGKDRDKWEAVVQKLVELVVKDCANIVSNQGAYMRYDALRIAILKKYNLE